MSERDVSDPGFAATKRQRAETDLPQSEELGVKASEDQHAATDSKVFAMVRPALPPLDVEGKTVEDSGNVPDPDTLARQQALVEAILNEDRNGLIRLLQEPFDSLDFSVYVNEEEDDLDREFTPLQAAAYME
eukprot:CAMPEP_0118949398 /NCGR_PEP_ID=MMETSP1169-20130426/49544_1 /TAXON_ID=36882 /ORGANISM="Pyramimonas obovata, Strain CCMP722" /LENGTH=131 /DNA_ID=CAMNT_0006896019 /DNA_START=170 /DNA_END=562 /DNA_ORIENTATION=+